MHIEQNAPPGASGGLPALAPDPWAIGIPPTYEAALGQLKALGREMQEAVVAGLIDHLNATDGDVDLEPEEDAGDEDQGGEASLGAGESVTCSEGPASAVRRGRRGAKFTTPQFCGIIAKPEFSGSLRVDRSCDQSDWPRDRGFRTNEDLELDTADDEPSLGAPECHPDIIDSGDRLRVDPYPNQEDWAAGASLDGEDDSGENPERVDEDGADDDHGEETLGWPANVSQKDLGQNHADGEWSLGSTNGLDQRHWAQGRAGDIEEQCDDEGECERDGTTNYKGSGCEDGTNPPAFADKSLPNLGRPFVNLRTFRDVYVMMAEGNCLSPEVCDGERIMFDRREAIIMRDLIAVFLDPAKVQPGQHQVIVKRFVGHATFGETLDKHGIVVEFGNPTPMRYVIPTDDILDVHKCIGKCPTNMPRVREATIG